MKAYKAFDENFQCRGYQFEVGKTYSHPGKVEVCDSGFHAVTSPLDMWKYYPPGKTRYALVDVSGKLDHHDEDSKVAASVLFVEREMTLQDVILAAVNESVSAALAASSDGSTLAASGNRSTLAASGYGSTLAASGYESTLAASGVCSTLAASGVGSIAMAAGRNSSASAGVGGVIALAYTDAYGRTRVAVGYVGEDGIQPNVAYKVKDGKLTPVA